MDKPRGKAGDGRKRQRRREAREGRTQGGRTERKGQGEAEGSGRETGAGKDVAWRKGRAEDVTGRG